MLLFPYRSSANDFDYAAALGVDLIVGVPGKKTGPKWVDVHSDRAMCEACSKLADEYRMRFAIHNHGRNPKTGNPNLYPAVPETYELIKDLSPRMGFCITVPISMPRDSTASFSSRSKTAATEPTLLTASQGRWYCLTLCSRKSVKLSTSSRWTSA